VGLDTFFRDNELIGNEALSGKLANSDWYCFFSHDVNQYIGTKNIIGATRWKY
jgi:hypothetical protein